MAQAQQFSTSPQEVASHQKHEDGMTNNGALIFDQNDVTVTGNTSTASTLPLTCSRIALVTTGSSGDNAFTLPDPVEVGTQLRIYLKTKAGTGSAVVTGSGIGSGTIATFNAVEDAIVLEWSGAKWRIFSNVSVSIS